MKKWLLIGLSIVIIIMIITGLYFNNIAPDLGVTSGQLKALPSSPNAVSSQTKDSERYVTPLLLNINSYKIIMTIINDFDRTKIITQSPTYIHAVFSTKVGFKDDVEFYFDEANGVIHFRSASRLGYSDMGVNKKRYEEIKRIYLKNTSD